MAKMAKMMDSGMCAPASCGPKCILLGLVHAVLASAGLFVIVGGIMKQWSGMMPWSNIVLWHTGGMILWGIAKMAKMKACPMCCR